MHLNFAATAECERQVMRDRTEIQGAELCRRCVVGTVVDVQPNNGGGPLVEELVGGLGLATDDLLDVFDAVERGTVTDELDASCRCGTGRSKGPYFHGQFGRQAGQIDLVGPGIRGQFADGVTHPICGCCVDKGV